MRIKIDCNSLLLQKALENFLVDYKKSEENFDIIITDNQNLKSQKHIFLISKKGNLQTPFSKEKLENSLREFFNQNSSPISLEEEIEKLVDNFKKDLLKVIKKYAKT